MKKFLIETLVFLLAGLVSGIGLSALIIALYMERKDSLIFIPAMIISWIILYPTYKYWTDTFKKILNCDENVK